MGMRQIRVGTRRIKVEMQGVRVEMRGMGMRMLRTQRMRGIRVVIWEMVVGIWGMEWECGESGWKCMESV